MEKFVKILFFYYILSCKYHVKLEFLSLNISCFYNLFDFNFSRPTIFCN